VNCEEKDPMERSPQDTEQVNGALLGIGMAIQHVSEIEEGTLEARLTIAEALRECFAQIENLWGA
jgi:hypothetical protein